MNNSHHHQHQPPLPPSTGSSPANGLVNNNYMMQNANNPNNSYMMQNNNNNNNMLNNSHHQQQQPSSNSMMNRQIDYDHLQYYNQRSSSNNPSPQQNFPSNGESQPNLSSPSVHPLNNHEHVFPPSNNNNMLNNYSSGGGISMQQQQHSQQVLINNQYSNPSPSFQYATNNNNSQQSQHQTFKQQPPPFSNYNPNMYPQQQQHQHMPPQQTFPSTTYSNTNYSSTNISNMPTSQYDNNVNHQQNYSNYEIATSFNSSPPPPQQSNINTFNPSLISNMPTDSPTTKKQKRKKSSSGDNLDVNGFSQDSIPEHGHPIACVQCRSRHKKCDRTLPSCLNCTKRGVECTYRSPKMKGRKDQKFHPYSSLLYIPPTNSSTFVSSQPSQPTQPKPKKQKKEQNVINQIVDNHFTTQWNPSNQNQNQQHQIEEQNNFNAQPLTMNNQLQNQLSNQLQIVMAQNASNFNNDSFSNLLTSLSNGSDNSKDSEEEENALAVIDSLQNSMTPQSPKIDREFLLNLSKDSISDLLGSLGVNQNNFPQNINIRLEPNSSITHDLIKDAEFNQRLNMNAYKKRTVELYDEVISMGYPLLSKSTLELAFFNEESMRGIYSNDVLALLYAIHAVTCQAFGVHDEANIGFQKSRMLLTDSYDNSQNIFVAGTYCHFARYCSGIGDKGKAKFYLNYVDLFFRKRNKNFKNKSHLNYAIEEETKNGENYSIFNGLPVDDLHLLKYRVLCGISVDKSGEFFLDDCANFPGFTFGSYVSKIICDGCLYAIGKIPNTIMGIMSQKVSLDNLNLYSMLVEFSANFLTIHEDERNISETTRSCMKCLHQLFYHGCNLQLYKEAGVTDERVENEAKLFTLTTASGPFHLVQPLTLGALFETATIHLKILAEIEQGKRNFDQITQIYQLIELDNRALEIVRTKNKELIDRTCKPLLDQLQFRTRQFASLPFYNSCSMTALIKDNFEVRRCSPVAQDKFNDAINILREELNK